MKPPLSKSEALAALPPPWPEDLRPTIRAMLASRPDHRLVVLDDDPTGTQTVHDVPVLTAWDTAALRHEFARQGRCFYILTNSRSLSDAEARALCREIARNLRAAAGRTRCSVVSRSDSTLRGHFPAETDVLQEELGPFDATILIPYFEAGGLLTIGDVHFVADGDRLTPAAESPFARDAAFGYRHSNLRDWVEEKTRGRISAREVASLSIETLRVGGPEAVARQLRALPPGAVCILNAAALPDLDVFVAGLLLVESDGARFLFRTAAQFVAARLGLDPRPLLGPKELDLPTLGGGLVVVGSHVPQTSQQLADLLARGDIHPIELPVPALLDPSRHDAAIGRAIAEVNAALADGRDAVAFTSRDILIGDGASDALRIGQRVSRALISLVQGLETRPRFLIAKGGITSSDLATRALGVRRAIVAGQILPGVPVWRLGPETRFPNLCYVVFPGNVGGPSALTDTMRRLTSQTPTPTRPS